MLSLRNTIISSFLFVSNVLAGYSRDCGKDIVETCTTKSSDCDDCYGIKSVSIGSLAAQYLRKYQTTIKISECALKSSIFEMTKQEYIFKTIEVINCIKRDKDLNMTIIKSTLDKIYCAFNTKGSEQLAVFTTHAIFNTSIFGVLQEKSDYKYRFRGLLAIRGKENYETLSHLSLFENFVEHPEKLACLDESAISATVKFYEHLSSGVLSYIESMDLLKPTEWTCHKNDSSKCSEDQKQRLQNRTLLYSELISAYQK